MSGSGPHKYAIIVAGGTGARMGSETPKQFLPLDGKPILMWTLEAFYAYSTDMRLVLVLHPGMTDLWESLCTEHNFRVPHTVVDGGEQRYHSVKNGLAHIPDGALVAIHDAVRPLVDVRVIRDSYEKADKCGSAVPVMPVNETVRRIHEEASSVVDRTFLFSVQTPQTFRTEVIRKAYEQDYDPGFTDDASLLEAMGMKVHFFPGDSRNIKITRQEDLEMAAQLMK